MFRFRQAPDIDTTQYIAKRGGSVQTLVAHLPEMTADDNLQHEDFHTAQNLEPLNPTQYMMALMASQHPKLNNLSFQELPRMQHEEVASALQDALIFLSCGHPEGFGLPLAEAIACGCLVVGYHGLAGRDFALPHMKVVEFGDLLGLLKGVEQELARFNAAPESVIQERLAASESILQTYSLEAELDCCLRTWANICPRMP